MDNSDSTPVTAILYFYQRNKIISAKEKFLLVRWFSAYFKSSLYQANAVFITEMCAVSGCRPLN